MKNKTKEHITINHLDVYKLTDNLYCINERNLTTMSLIIGKDRALVVDCGVGIYDFKGIIEQLTDKPYDVVLTHAHVDHCGGRGQFDTIYVHRDDLEMVEHKGVSLRRIYAAFHAFKKPGLYLHRIKKVKKKIKYIPIEDGYVFDLGETRVRVIHVSGHTVGCIALLMEKERILLSGDTINSRLYLFLPHASSVERYIESAKYLLAMDGYDKIYGSHSHRAITREDAMRTVNTAISITKMYRKNSKHPIYRIKLKNRSLLIYRTDRIFKRDE